MALALAKLATLRANDAKVSATLPAELTDAELAERARAGDRTAFEAIVRRYQKPLFRAALRYVRRDADAADVCQRAFVRAFKSLESLQKTRSLRSWLYRIAINLSLNHIRDRRDDAPLDLDALPATSAPVGTDRLIAGEQRRALVAAIAELPPKQRAVLELRIYDELPFREVAEIVGSSENAAKVNYHHAVKRLRAILGKEAAS